jgi:hypothetical protein
MSNFENLRKVLKKGLFLDICHENAHNHRKSNYKNVTIIFTYFLKKRFRDFYVSLIYTNVG